MHLELKLSEDQQNALWQLANASGLDVSAYLRQLIEAQVSQPATSPLGGPLSREQWQQRFESLVSRHRPTGFPLDDSRESIYSGRA